MTISIAAIFGKSPVMPLEKHMGIVLECAHCLQAFFSASAAADWDAAQLARQDIERLEQKADDLKREIRLNMPRRLFMPVPREDLLGLLLAQDRIANKAQQMTGAVVVRKMQIPAEIADDFLSFVGVNVSAVQQANKSVQELDELYTATFAGSEAELVEQMIDRLDELENEIDSRQLRLQSSLHALEPSLDPVSTVFLYQTIALTGAIGHAANDVGRRLELLLSR